MRWNGPGAGILVGRFEGPGYLFGARFGRLTRTRFLAEERHLDRLVAALIPNAFARAAILKLSAFRLRNIDREIPPDLLVEIAGIADGLEPAPPPAGWPAYGRLLGLHALHDVSQRFVDAPALASACSGFLASGRASAGGRTLLARDFDFEGGTIFDREKIAGVFVREGKIPYLAVGFGGMLGVVSGFNREGIGVALQSISGGETRTVGLPMSLLMADVLANEGTFEGAIQRIRRAHVFVSDLVLLADGKTGRTAVLEKTPSAFAVRETGPLGWAAATNVARSEAVRRLGRPLPPGSTAERREARLVRLLTERAGPALDVPAAVAILRDRRSASRAELGPGNRNAIDGLITAHSIVFDLTARRAWVAAAPHALGAYVPVDLEAVLADREGISREPLPPIPADPFLDSGFERYRAARAAMRQAHRALERDGAGLDAARRALEEAHTLSPDFAEATARLGEVLALLGDKDRALTLLEDALGHEPGPEPLRRGIERLRDALANGTRFPRGNDLPALLEPDELIEESRRLESKTTVLPGRPGS
jgi:isopenicillin-N N-acyltransferase like protein